MTETELAEMVALSGLGYPMTDVADETDRARNTVSDHLGRLRERVEDGDEDPVEVALDALEGLYRQEYRLRRVDRFADG